MNKGLRVRHLGGMGALMAICLMLGIGLAASAAWGTDVSVYAEGAYTQSELVVYIYADIDTPAIRSFGVKLGYSPTELTLTSASKEEAIWYLGDSASNHPYMDPDGTTAGEIVFIGAKLDVNNPSAGVSGQKVLLGKARFARKSSDTPVATPETFFGIALNLGKEVPFTNFAAMDGVSLDSSVEFSRVTVRERGDANADGKITPADMLAVRNAYYGGAPLSCELAADCNGDGHVTPADMICVRNKYYNP